MKKVTFNQVNKFINNTPIALYGVSAKQGKMGNSIFKELTAKGYKLFPMHREMETFENHNCYKNLTELPEKVDAAIVCTKQENTESILNELQNYGVSQVWLQQGSADSGVISKAFENFENVIYGKCILMFANQTGVHKFHSRILRIFGKYPKVE